MLVTLISRANTPSNRLFSNNQNNYKSLNFYSYDKVTFARAVRDLKSPDMSEKDFKKHLESKVANIKPSNKMNVVSELTEVLDLYLQNKWTEESHPAKKQIVLENLKKVMGKQGQGNIVMAQINPTPGNVEENAKKHMRYIKAAESIGVDLVVFHESSLMGYPIHDTVDRHPIIVKENMDWLKEIAKQTGKTRALVGFVESRDSKKVGKSYYNSVALLGDGKILGITRKSLLPTYKEFNDYRYNEPSPVTGNQPPETLGHFGRDKVQQTSKLNDVHGKKYGIVICEDGWNDKSFFDNNVLYETDPVSDVAKERPDMIVNCSASPSRTQKEQFKYNMLYSVASKHEIPMIYVNQVGAIDDSSFDGSSRVHDLDGKIIARAKSFEEQFMICNPVKKEGKIYPLAKGLNKTLHAKKKFSLNYEPDMDRTYKTVVQGIRDYFQKNGIKRAVLGLSGGLDSTVSAVLVADAIGAKNVYGVSMPAKITSKESRDDAKVLAKNLGIHFTEVPIKGMVDSTNAALKKVFAQVRKDWDGEYKESYVQDNIQARSRATLLWGITNQFASSTPIATSDKSELYMGYATINGDMSGGFAPIADIPKTKLFALAHWMNKNRPQKDAIPEVIIAKPPGAELAIDPKTGKPLVAEDALMPYQFMDEVIWRIESKRQGYKQILRSPFVYEKKNQVDKKQKEIWLDRFYKRMSTALFKWSILPPSVIVEGSSINKAEYKQPITSGRIDYKGITRKEIAKKLKTVK